MSEKTRAQLDLEIEIAGHLGPSDTNGRLVVLDGGGESKGKATHAHIKEYVQTDSIGGDKDASIAVRYNDENDNDVAVSLTRAEAKRLLPLVP